VYDPGNPAGMKVDIEGNVGHVSDLPFTVSHRQPALIASDK
jgi:hypothetical protein